MFKKKSKKFMGVALLLVVTMLGAIGCSSGEKTTEPETPDTPTEDVQKPEEQAPEKKENTHKELTIYTALPDVELPFYLDAFEKETGIKVHYVRLSAGEILAKLQVEKNNPQASIWYGGPIDTFIAAMGEDLLDKYESSEIGNVPVEYVDPTGHWSPIYVGPLGFAVNSDWFEKEGIPYPETWDDLLKPEFKNELSMAHPGSSGTAYTVLSTILQLKGEEKGWEYFKEFDKNIRQYTKAGAAPAKNAALGESAIGIIFSHDGLKPAAEGYPIEVVFPQDGTGYEVGGIALIKNGPEKEVENAKLFIDWAMGENAQTLFETSESFRLPINANVEPAPGLVNISDLKVIDYDFEWAGENRVKLIEEFSDKIVNQDNLE